MKKLLLPGLLLLLFLTGCTTSTKENVQSTRQSENQINEITRRNELQLEGFINDYFYRKQIKDSFLFGDFNAYGSVLSKSVVVYVYPKNKLTQKQSSDIEKMIKDGLTSTLFDFSDFEWAKKYSLDVVIK